MLQRSFISTLTESCWSNLSCTISLPAVFTKYSNASCMFLCRSELVSQVTLKTIKSMLVISSSICVLPISFYVPILLRRTISILQESSMFYSLAHLFLILKVHASSELKVLAAKFMKHSGTLSIYVNLHSAFIRKSRERIYEGKTVKNLNGRVSLIIPNVTVLHKIRTDTFSPVSDIKGRQDEF